MYIQVLITFYFMQAPDQPDNRSIEEIRETLPRFMNLRTDFAFKKIFGEEKNKHILLNFLNILFEPEITIKDLTFKKQEILPFQEKGRRVVYDVYANTEDGRKIVVEMQQAPQAYFMNRALIYTGMGMVHQAKRGKWNYKTRPVFGVFIMNFSLSGLKPKMVRRAGVSDLEPHEKLTDAERWFFIDLSQMHKGNLEECENKLERLIYCIKNMEKFKEKPKGYDELNDLFEAAETASLANEDVVPYSQSEQRLYDEEMSRLEYGQEMERVGEQRGIKKGIKEGFIKGMTQMAKALKEAGIDLDIIQKSSGLSPEVIAAL